MKKLRGGSVAAALALACAVGATGCNNSTPTPTPSGGTGSGSTSGSSGYQAPGVLNLNLTAQSDDFSYYEIQSAKVTISKVVVTDSSGTQTTVSSTPQTVDLMSMTNGATFQIGTKSISASTISSVTLDISSATLTPFSGSAATLTVPNSGVTLNLASGVALASSGKANILVDFNLLDTFQATTDTQGNITAWTFAPSAVAVDQSQSGSISGVVLSNMGTPSNAKDDLGISDALIEIKQGGKTVATGVSEFGGTFSVIGLAPGKYDVTASDQNGYTAMTTNAITVSASKAASVSFTLGLTSGAVYGQVVNGTYPVAGADVELVDGSNNNIGYAQTDASGNYYIDGLANEPASSYTINVSANGYISNSESGPQVAKGIASKAASIALSLSTGSVVGQITDANSGTSISGALVDVYPSGSGQVVAYAYTDYNGFYSIANLAAGSYTVTVNANGYNQFVQNGDPVEAGSTTSVDAQLVLSTGALSGTITDMSNNDLGGATVTVSQGGWLIAQTTTNIWGNYSILGLEPGTYDVSVNAYGYNSESVTYEIIGGTMGIEDFQMTLVAGDIGGVVTDSSTSYPISGAQVTISQGGYLVASTSTATDGSYQVDGLAPGTYYVAITAYGYNEQDSNVTVLGNDFETDDASLVPTVVMASTGAIAGVITDYNSGAALVGAAVQIYDAVSGSLISTVYTDNTGVYDADGLSPGTYNVVASASGYTSDEIDGDSVYANQTTNQSIALDLASVTGSTGSTP